MFDCLSLFKHIFSSLNQLTIFIENFIFSSSNNTMSWICTLSILLTCCSLKRCASDKILQTCCHCPLPTAIQSSSKGWRYLSLDECQVATLHPDWLRVRFLKVPLPEVAGGKRRRTLKSQQFLAKTGKKKRKGFKVTAGYWNRKGIMGPTP